MSNLLIVDDEESICWGLSKIVEGLGYTPITKPSAEDALQLPPETSPLVIVLDVRLPGMSGLDAIAKLRSRFGEVPIIVMTAHGDLQTAVDAIRHGACEYVLKPFETEQIRELIQRAVNMGPVGKASADASLVAKIDGMAGTSRAMQEVFSRIALAAAADAGVLIQGESGTGKELAARAVHRYSKRSEGPFVAVNMAALSSSLAESEVFGHAKGAFTGADSDRVGLLEQADGGSLFLDELGDIPLEMQVKLLRAIEHGSFLPVGSSSPVESDFRVISATNSDLLDDIRTGAFRHDLYYRLSAFRIDLPPLRERQGDAVLLAEQFMLSLSPNHNQSLTTAAAEEISERSWHGNVRELRNAIEHAIVVARGGNIEPRHLPDPVLIDVVPSPEGIAAVEKAIEHWVNERLAAGDSAEEIGLSIATIGEKALIAGTLSRHHGNFSAAAKDLGMHRTTLRKKVEELSLKSSPSG